MKTESIKEIKEMNEEELKNRLVQAEKQYEKAKEIYDGYCATYEMEDFMDACYELELIYKRFGRIDEARRKWEERSHAMWAYSHEMFRTYEAVVPEEIEEFSEDIL